MIYKMSGEDTSNANYPVVKEGMQKVYWKEDGTEVKEGEEGFEISKWYNYKEQKGRTDEYDEKTQEWGSSHWANVILDGNYYVWIPRYCYKIYNNPEEEGYEEYITQEEGKSYRIDVKFLSETSNQAPEGYIVHPAFTFGDQELKGIWVGKYETSGDQNTPTILPNKKSIVTENAATMFYTAQKLSKKNIDAHMMKNMEWGAVSYLTQSQYGRNGTEISVNQCDGFITGAGRGIDANNPIYNSIYSVNEQTNLPQKEQQYNGKIGKLSSTTGNIYGIYDMSGGAYEDVMAFYEDAEGKIYIGTSNDENQNLGFNGHLFDGTEKTDGKDFPDNNKYYEVYKNSGTSGTFNTGKQGDATKETAKWNDDNAAFVIIGAPMFRRGGAYDHTKQGGIFYFFYDSGNTNNTRGFRVCLAIEN